MQRLLESVKAQCALQFNFSEDAVALKRRLQEYFIPLPDVQKKLVLELCGLEAPYPRAEDAHLTEGYRCPDIDLVLLDGTTASMLSLLRSRKFLLIDLEGFGHQFKKLDVSTYPVDIIQARLAKIPDVLSDVKALLVRPDGYIAWASSNVGQSAEVETQFAKWFGGRL